MCVRVCVCVCARVHVRVYLPHLAGLAGKWNSGVTSHLENETDASEFPEKNSSGERAAGLRRYLRISWRGCHTHSCGSHTLSHTHFLSQLLTAPSDPGRLVAAAGRVWEVSVVESCRPSCCLVVMLLCCIIATQRVACAHTALSPPLTCCVALVCSRMFHLYSKRKNTLKQKKRQCLTFTRRQECLYFSCLNMF